MTKKKKTAKAKAKKTAPKKSAVKKAYAPAPRRLLQAGEPQPFRVENERGRGVGLIISDHASNRVPRALKDMGLKKADLKKHIAWDIGAEDATLHIARTLDMPAILAQYSRLVVDLNRDPQHEECVPAVSDRIAVPANENLSKKARDQRLKEVYWPYQNKIGKLLDRFVKKKQVPMLFSIHSFTPVMQGFRRPWHISLLWNKEEKIARRIVQAIRRAHPNLLVGENEPYTLIGDRFKGSTIWRHAEERGLPYIFVEFRQDLVDTRQKAVQWANLLLEASRPVLEDPSVFAGRRPKTGKK